LLNLPPLYPITDARLDISLPEQIRKLGATGFPLVQFRAKELDAKAQWEALRQALIASRENGGWPAICVNDRADLALLATGEGLSPWGLHLGQADLPPGEARKLPGLEALHIGTSTHGVEEWHYVDQACDHAGVGPFRATQTKGDHAAPIGLEGLRQGCSILRRRGLAPIAIGGLTMEDASACYEAGAESLAMVGEIARSENPRELLWEAQAMRWQTRPVLRKGQGIALVGGSGCGKSTLAKVLAKRLGLLARDLDEVIAERAGKPIPRIFAEDGEPVFRRLEAEATNKAFETPAVLALGGGAWENELIRNAARTADYAVLWIAEDPGRVWKRVALDPNRPLAQDPQTFFQRWRNRMPRWMEASMILPLGRGCRELADAFIACNGL